MTVTVCVPVCNGAAFVEETLASLARQTFADLKILISVDKSDDRTLEIVRAFAESEPRAHLFAQATRLGFAGNVNFLLRKIESEFAAIMPHDDVLQPPYYEKLVEKLNARPAAILAYSDIETFGDGNGLRVGPEAVGDRLSRILQFLEANDDAVAYRGVFRTKVLDRGCYHEEESGAAADQTWLLRLAIEGDLVRVAEPLYRKRIHPASFSTVAADSHWADHCAACQRIALAAGPWTLDQRRAISAAVVFRATRDVWMSAALDAPLHESAYGWLSSLFSNLADFTLRLSGGESAGSPHINPGSMSKELQAQLARRVGILLEKVTDKEKDR